MPQVIQVAKIIDVRDKDQTIATIRLMGPDSEITIRPEGQSCPDLDVEVSKAGDNRWVASTSEGLLYDGEDTNLFSTPEAVFEAIERFWG